LNYPAVKVAVRLAPLLVVLAACGNGATSTADSGTDSGTDAGADAGPPPGSLLWAQHIGGVDYIEEAAAGVFGNQGHSVAALSDGTFCADGSFMNGAVFGAGTANEIELQSAGGVWDGDGFIGRWLPDGTPAWVLPVGGDGSYYVDGFAEFERLPDNSVIAVVQVENGANLDPLGDAPVTLDDDNGLVAPVYDADGRLVRYIDWIGGGEDWTHGAGYTLRIRVRAAPDGTVVMSNSTCCYEDETVILGTDEPNETVLTSDPDSLSWSVIGVYDPAGFLEWGVKLENGSHEFDLTVGEIAVSAGGEVLAAGSYFEGEAVVFGSDGSSTSLPCSDAGPDTSGNYLAKWNAEGILQWVKQIPTLGPSPLFFRDDGTIVWIDAFRHGNTFDPGGPAEVAIDAPECAGESPCFFVVEIAQDGSSFEPRRLSGPGGGYMARRPDGSFTLATWREGVTTISGYGADFDPQWEAVIEPNGAEAGAWIHDIAALADGSVVVIGDYTDSIVLGAGEPNETTLHGVCDECRYGAFLARYAW
jgi:hypothetical protein